MHTYFSHLRESLTTAKANNPRLDPEVDAILLLLPDLSPSTEAAFVQAFYAWSEARAMAERDRQRAQSNP